MTKRSKTPPWTPLAVPLSLALVGLASAAALWAQEPASEETEFALVRPLALESLLLDGAGSGDHLVAVGERGHVLVSRDGGDTWTQSASVPTRATLTAVFLHDEQLGWAVGHDAVILRTTDGGDTWEMLYSAPDEQLPLLDVWFRDADNGLAIGAYGYFLQTRDGGDTWTQIQLEVTGNDDAEDIFAYDEGGDFHLNHLSPSPSGGLYIAAEAGTIYRSLDDRGMSWESLPSPYGGSFFGALPLDGDSLLVFGLRGHLFRSDDRGETWRQLDAGTEAMLTDAVRLDDGTIVLVGLGGAILASGDGGESFDLHAQPDRQAYSAVLVHEGNLVLFGEFGVTRLPISTLGTG